MYRKQWNAHESKKFFAHNDTPKRKSPKALS